VTFYYDPTIDYHHRLPVGRAGLFPAYFLAPQKPVEARALFSAVLESLGMADPAAPAVLDGPQRTPMIIHLSREWGLHALADALGEAADEHYEPTWNDERGEFTWGFGLDEEHPRGQFNAAMAAAEAMSPGAWSGLFGTAPRERFAQPTVEGIDFPDLALTQAWWDPGDHRLLLATTPRNDALVGRPTTFRLTNLPGASAWTVEADSAAATPTTTATGPDRLEVTTTIGSHRFVARPG
jgi:hypothetical protein